MQDGGGMMKGIRLYKCATQQLQNGFTIVDNIN
jgi:hypothetical protein